jgi:hypothetical protein
MPIVKEKKQEHQMDRQEAMRVMQEMGTPGPIHESLAKMTGSWTTKNKSWYDPSMPPRESTGTSEQEMILDGRILQEKHTGDMMGMPFKGLGLLGYNNFTQKFSSIWMDSTSTAILYFEGTASQDGKTVTMKSRSEDMVMGPMKFRSVTKLVDNDNYAFELYGTDKSGKESKMMEMLYTRNK